MSDVFVNRGNQFGHAGEYTAAQPLGREITEKALDHVAPRRRGWCEVHVKLKFRRLPPEFSRSINHLRWIRGFVF
jgi:hypothetical protein